MRGMESCPPKSPQTTASAGPAGVAPAQCLRCGADLSRLPEEGRYCPRCGLDSHASPPAALLLGDSRDKHQLSDTLGAWQHLTQFRVSNDIPAPRVPQPQAPAVASSEILEGYANALYKLGQRYERAQGVGGNFREALRCYCKSARLGNLWAMGRLAAYWLGRRDPFDRDQQQTTSLPRSDS